MRMEWFNFSDINFVILFSIVLSIIVLLLFFSISWIIVRKSNQAFQKKILEEKNSTRIYIIDVKNNLVTFFNKSDIKHKRNMNLSNFYSHFHPNDADKVKGWIFAISFDNKNVDQYLEADVLINYGRSTRFSLLKLIQYDPKVGLIHLESTILKYITPNNERSKKRRGMYQGVVRRSQMANIINKRQALSGFTFAIRFFYLKGKTLSNDKIERYTTLTLKNVVYPFLTENKNMRHIVDINESEIVLFDLRMEGKENAIRLANSIYRSLMKSSGVNGFTDSINFTIGIVENSQFFQDFDSIVEKSEEACMLAQQNNTPVYLFQRSASTVSSMARYKLEVEHLMVPNTLRYLFRPLIDIINKDVIGYFEYVRAYDSPFSGYNEMSKYAARAEKNRELFATVANNVLPKFYYEAQDKNWKLFFSVSMTDINDIIDILTQTNGNKDTKIVLVFDEQEVNENSKDIEMLNNALLKFKNNGFELGLSLKDKNLLLDPSVYFNFDYFIAGSAMIGEIKRNNRIRLSIHTLIEQLLQYKKPIIATDLESWQAIELIIKSGITMISSEIISPSNDMLLPLEKKKIDKLNQMWEKYR